MGDKPHMTGAQAITGLYLLAALAALVAAFYWFQLVKVHSAEAYKGAPVTWRHLPQAAAFTGFTMALAAIGFIASIA